MIAFSMIFLGISRLLRGTDSYSSLYPNSEVLTGILAVDVFLSIYVGIFINFSSQQQIRTVIATSLIGKRKRGLQRHPINDELLNVSPLIKIFRGFVPRSSTDVEELECRSVKVYLSKV